jgi:hypothetical protein
LGRLGKACFDPLALSFFFKAPNSIEIVQSWPNSASRSSGHDISVEESFLKVSSQDKAEPGIHIRAVTSYS